MGSEIQGFANLQSALKLFRITDQEVKIIQAYAEEASKYLDVFIDDFCCRKAVYSKKRSSDFSRWSLRS